MSETTLYAPVSIEELNRAAKSHCRRWIRTHGSLCVLPVDPNVYHRHYFYKYLAKAVIYLTAETYGFKKVYPDMLWSSVSRDLNLFCIHGCAYHWTAHTIDGIESLDKEFKEDMTLRLKLEETEEIKLSSGLIYSHNESITKIVRSIYDDSFFCEIDRDAAEIMAQDAFKDVKKYFAKIGRSLNQEQTASLINKLYIYDS